MAAMYLTVLSLLVVFLTAGAIVVDLNSDNFDQVNYVDHVCASTAHMPKPRKLKLV